MPKSKRNKMVDLSKTKKHGMEGKKKLYEEIRSCVESYANIFIFSVNDMRNSKIKNVREQWKHSRFFIGKNKVMAKALGTTTEDSFRDNLYKIGQRLKGERGLLFSNQSVEDVLKWFNSYSEGDYARSGNRATETVVLPEGPLSQFPHNLEPYLRQLGLPTTLKKGVIHLLHEHTVCNEGDVLTPESAKILKLLGYEMAEFYIKIESVWSQNGSFVSFISDKQDKENLNSLSFENSTDTPQAADQLEEMEVVESDIAKDASTKDNLVEKDDDEEIPELVEDDEDKDVNANMISTEKKNPSIETGSSDTIEKETNKLEKKTEKISKSKKAKAIVEENVSEKKEQVEISNNEAESMMEESVSEEEEEKVESPIVRKLRNRSIKVVRNK